jgi:hypothetical protein
VLLLLGGGFLIHSSTRPDVDTPSSFTASLLDVGWELHTSKNGDFTLALLPSWSRYTKAIPISGPYLKFAAWGLWVEEHQEAWPYVFKTHVRSGQSAQSYFEHERVQIWSDPVRLRSLPVMRPDQLERQLRQRLGALGPAPRAELLNVLTRSKAGGSRLACRTRPAWN